MIINMLTLKVSLQLSIRKEKRWAVIRGGNFPICLSRYLMTKPVQRLASRDVLWEVTLTHLWRMDLLIITICVNPLLLLGHKK